MNLLINSFNEVYGACQTQTKVSQIFKLNNLSADEGSNPEKKCARKTLKTREREKRKQIKKGALQKLRIWLEKVKVNGVLICLPISV